MNNKEKLYRVTYKGEGIYEALRKKITIEEWKELLNSNKFNWLPKPKLYNSNNRSYFTEKGYKKFMDEAYQIMTKHLSESNIMIEEFYNIDNIIYEDEYQIISVID